MRWTYQPTVGGRGLQGCRYNSLPFSSLCSPTGRLRLLSRQELFQLYIFSLPHFISSSFFFFLEAPSTPQKILGLALPGSRTLFTPLHTCCDLQSSLTSSSSLSSPNDLCNRHDDHLHRHYCQNDNIIKITIIIIIKKTTTDKEELNDQKHYHYHHHHYHNHNNNYSQNDRNSPTNNDNDNNNYNNIARGTTTSTTTAMQCSVKKVKVSKISN